MHAALSFMFGFVLFSLDVWILYVIAKRMFLSVDSDARQPGRVFVAVVVLLKLPLVILGLALAVHWFQASIPWLFAGMLASLVGVVVWGYRNKSAVRLFQTR